jgi:hypothetical protein
MLVIWAWKLEETGVRALKTRGRIGAIARGGQGAPNLSFQNRRANWPFGRDYASFLRWLHNSRRMVVYSTFMLVGIFAETGTFGFY